MMVLYLPNEIKTKSMGGVSKKVIGDVSSDMIIEATTTATEYWRTKNALFYLISYQLLLTQRDPTERKWIFLKQEYYMYCI